MSGKEMRIIVIIESQRDVDLWVQLRFEEDIL